MFNTKKRITLLSLLLLMMMLLDSSAYAVLNPTTTTYSIFKTKEHEELLDNPELMAAAKVIPHTGELDINSEGFIYLKISDQFIKQLYPRLVKHLSTREQVCISRPRVQVGAHISVFYPQDTRYLSTQEKANILHKTYAFTTEKLVKWTFNKRRRYGVVTETYYLITLHLPQLEPIIHSLQAKHPELAGPEHAFKGHISLAVSFHVLETGQCLTTDRNY